MSLDSKPETNIPAAPAAPPRPWRRMPNWALFPSMGGFYLFSILLLGLVLVKAGPPFLATVNGLKSWSQRGGWRGLLTGLALASVLMFLAALGWFFAMLAKSMENELKLRLGL
ncbi:MAG: hypothetical protein JF570_10825 [Caulobacter sp.]|nr:hypothetical protein [Caulobacter sp.]